MRRARAGLLMALLLHPWTAMADAPGSEEVLVDAIAAQVGSEIVLVSEVMQLVADQEPRMRAAGATDVDIARVRAEALETVIEWRLMERMVEQAELYATDAEIDATIDAIAQENNLSLAKLKRDLGSQGMSWDGYRGEIKRELERRKVLNAVVATRVQVEDEEIEELYEARFAGQPDTGTTVHLRQILVPGGEESPLSVEDACRMVRTARQKVEEGDSFQELASRISAVAPERGGDLGWLHVDSVAAYLRELIAPLEPGELSPVQEIPVGCTFVELVERKEWSPVSLEQAKTKLQAEVFERKMMEKYREWMDELRGQTFIERRGYFADAAQFERKSGGGAGLGDISVLGGDAAEGESTR